MRLGHFRGPPLSGLRLSVDPLFLVVLGVVVCLGKPVEAALVVIALAAHELAHLALADAAGVRPLSLHLMPFGGVLTLAEDLHLRPPVELMVAAAGPAANLALAALAAWLRPSPFMAETPAAFAVQVNLALAAVNLLPAQPLDGGRVLRAVLAEWWGEKRAGRVCRRWSTLVILAVAVGALVVPLVSPAHLAWSINLLALAAFLQLGRARATAPSGQLFFQRLRRKRQDLRDGRILAGRHLVVSEDTPLVSVLERLRAGAYHFIAVCGPDLSLRGMAGEVEAVRVLEEKGPGATGADLLR